MITAELFSWPVTLAIMVLAFGSLVAAGPPLLLTVAGLVASAGGYGRWPSGSCWPSASCSSRR